MLCAMELRLPLRRFSPRAGIKLGSLDQLASTGALKFGKGPLDDAAYENSSICRKNVQKKNFFKYFLIISMHQTQDTLGILDPSF